MAVLRSYVGGSWFTPSDAGRPVLDAVTGDEVTRISSAGIDFGAALDYGRRTGGPALRELTFHQRAMLLKSLGLLLREHRPELYELSARTGATLADSKFDVDGGIGVLLSYASKARRELPNDTIYVDGPVEPLGKGGTFAGQHILTPLRGVAVQINAFNFPVWGPLEKFAPAFIAGVPTLVKPASQTAYLTARLVELMTASGLLPDGALQLVCGSPGDLLDHVGEQDLVCFTGSASTARQLRAHPAITSRSVRFNAEADSLNCSILGPDAEPGTQEFDLYVRQLVTEMTVKAGQKCTAIRRALVPPACADSVTDAVRDRLARVVVGSPADPDVRMGALASLDQREEVRRNVKALRAAGRLVYGDPDRVEVAGASADRGAFIAPLLLRSDDNGRPNRTRWRRSARSARLSATRTRRRPSNWPRWAGAAWPDRSSPPTPPSPATWCSAWRPGTAGCWCWTGTTWASRPGTDRRCRCWCTADQAGRAAARKWAACAACCTTCSGPRCRAARRCWRR